MNSKLLNSRSLHAQSFKPCDFLVWHFFYLGICITHHSWEAISIFQLLCNGIELKTAARWRNRTKVMSLISSSIQIFCKRHVGESVYHLPFINFYIFLLIVILADFPLKIRLFNLTIQITASLKMSDCTCLPCWDAPFEQLSVLIGCFSPVICEKYLGWKNLFWPKTFELSGITPQGVIHVDETSKGPFLSQTMHVDW